jgi:TetR/AcrR family transcriptional regulator, transcriptional repressor for nem operon
MSRTEQKEQTRQRVIQAAARGFRSHGYGAIGVDGLAREAGVTSGAFYKHFASKSEAFREAVRHGMEDLLGGVRYFQEKHGAGWWPAFVRFYLNEKRTCDLAESCTLQSLSAEVARSDAAARQLFDDAFARVADAVVDGPRSPNQPRTREEAQVALCSLAGAVTMARAVASDAAAAQIAEAMARALLPE